MDKLWSPWRSKYIESFKPGNESVDECLFCKVRGDKDDKKNLVLYRGVLSYVIMNLYPYNNGHVMIVPYQHKSQIKELFDETQLEIMKLITVCCEMMNNTIYPQGFNIGANIGKCAGAGIEDHIHFHVVPRWNGDTNFMPVLSDVKLVSEMLEDTYNKFKKALESIRIF